MPSERIPFGNQQASGLEELAGASPAAINVVMDKTGTVFRRPGSTGLAGSQTTGYPIGLYVSLSNRVFGVYDTAGEREIWDLTAAIDQTGSALRLAGSGGSASGLAGTARPVFAETEMIIAVAGGAAMQKIVLGGPESTDRLGGSPPSATHVVANQSRLLANDVVTQRTIVRYSGIAQGTITYAGLEQWSLGIGNAGSFAAEADPDPILSVVANSNEVWTLGPRTTQLFGSDPQTVFAPVATRELGVGAAYSVIAEDQNFHWLDARRRFVSSDGRSYSVLSDDIQATLDAMTTVSDCYGFRIRMGPLDTLVWKFPTDGRTFALQKGGGWSEWLYWSPGTHNWEPWPVQAYAYRPATGQHIVGLGNPYNAKIEALSLSATADYAGSIPMHASVRTGFLNHGTDAYKECLCVYFALRRGETQAAVGPQAFFWWADSPGEVMDKIPIDLGASGDREIVWPVYGLGTYRRRQWFFEFAGTEPLTLVSATEEFAIEGGD